MDFQLVEDDLWELSSRFGAFKRRVLNYFESESLFCIHHLQCIPEAPLILGGKIMKPCSSFDFDSEGNTSCN